MSTETIIPADVMHDLEELCKSAETGKPVDPVIALRVQKRAEKVREELRKKPPTNIAVELIREARDQ